MYSLRSSDAILADIRDAGQCTGHSFTQIRPQLISKKMRSKTNFRKNLRKTRSITAAAFILLGFLLARVTELPTQLEYKYFLQNTIFWGTDSQYSTIFFPVTVDRSMFPQSTSSVARAVFFARHKSCGLSKYNYKLPSLKFPMTIMRAQPGVFFFL